MNVCTKIINSNSRITAISKLFIKNHISCYIEFSNQFKISTLESNKIIKETIISQNIIKIDFK